MISAEQKKQLVLYSDLPFDPDLCRDEFLHEIFEVAADRLPDKVAFQIPRTEFIYVAMLGILKAGTTGSN